MDVTFEPACNSTVTTDAGGIHSGVVRPRGRAAAQTTQVFRSRGHGTAFAVAVKLTCPDDTISEIHHIPELYPYKHSPIIAVNRLNERQPAATSGVPGFGRSMRDQDDAEGIDHVESTAVHRLQRGLRRHRPSGRIRRRATVCRLTAAARFGRSRPDRRRRHGAGPRFPALVRPPHRDRCHAGDAEAPGMPGSCHGPVRDGARHGCQTVGIRRPSSTVVMHLILAVMPEPGRGVKEAVRVLKPGGRIAVFDKFLPDDEGPSLKRRLLNAIAKPLFSDLNWRLRPTDCGDTPRHRT